jgi:hypothetical protein
MKHYVFAGMFVAASAVSASAATCESGGVTVDDFAPATAFTCNISGNDTGGMSTFLADLSAGTIFSGYGSGDIMETWSLLGKSDALGDGVDAQNGLGDGVWSASGVGEYIVVTLKAGPEFSAYLFSGLTDSDISGTFDTFLAGLGNGTDTDGRALSHMSVFTAGEIVVSEVPLPAAGLMLLTALGGAAAMRRRNG